MHLTRIDTESSISSPAGRRSPINVAFLAVLSFTIWLHDSSTRRVGPKDAGESSEKALMIILSIAVAGIVSVAAIAYINSKTALFK